MAFKSKKSGKWQGRIYQPTKGKKGDKGAAAWEKANAWEHALRTALVGHIPEKPWNGPVRLTVEAFFERPQKLLTKKSPSGAIRFNKKPDADNVVKAIMDVLVPTKAERKEWKRLGKKPEDVGGFVLRDDCQVHLGPVDRWYVAKDHAPGVWITLEKIKEDPCSS